MLELEGRGTDIGDGFRSNATEYFASHSPRVFPSGALVSSGSMF